MGHSLGALVNSYAVDYVHGHKRGNYTGASQPWPSANTHVTIFDDAAISRLIGKETLVSLALEGVVGFTSSTVLGWKNPVPHDFGWLDNYIASVGRYHVEGVNVVLQDGMLFALANRENSWWDAAVEAHGYGMSWYLRTITNSAGSLMGFGKSIEFAATHVGTTFPPRTLAFSPGVAYRQKNNGDELALELVTDLDSRLFYPALTVVADAGLEDLNAHLNAAGNWVETKVHQAESAVVKAGNAGVRIVQTTVRNAETGFEGVVNSVEKGAVDLLNRPSYGLDLITGPPPGLFGPDTSRRTKAPDDLQTNTPAGLWLSVAFPGNVSVMAFDFVVDGDGKDDSLVFAVNGTNQFTLATKFAPSGVTNTSRFIDASAYAGTTNELFFGILGGTSTNCTVGIEGIRFFSLAQPSLAVAQTNGITTLSWSSAFSGYGLETATSPLSGAWAAVANPPALFAGSFSVTNSWQEQTRFFRLSRQ